MRGQGRIFKRGNRFWIAFYYRGKEYRESAGDTEREAKRYLKKRLQEIAGDKFIGPEMERITINEIADGLISHLERKGAKAVGSFKSHLKPIREVFGFDRAVDLTTPKIEKFINVQLEEGKARATVNREVGALKQALNLALKQGRLARVPYMPSLKEDNARTGFFEKGEFEALVEHLKQPVRDIVTFGYYTGWRKSEITGLKWNHVDRAGQEIRLRTSKNDCGRVLPIQGKLKELIEQRWEAREVVRPNGATLLSEYVFHNKGNAVVDFRKAWASACGKAGLDGKLFHDLRRTAVRNMIRAGVPQTVAMSISGHKTIAIFNRYNITSSDDQRKALLQTEEHVSSLPGERKVVKIQR